MILAVDTETTGLNSYKGDKPFAISTWLDETGYIKPYIEIGTDDLVPVSLALESPNYIKIFHNAKFDIQMLAVYNMPVKHYHDTMIMAHVFKPDLPKALKKLAMIILDEYPKEEEELKTYMRKHKLKDYSKVPREIMEPYAIADVKYTLGLYDYFAEQGVLEDPIYKMEMKLLHVLIDIQRRGFQIDIPYCLDAARNCGLRIGEIEDEIKTLFGDVNVASNKQLGEFFRKRRVPISTYSATGNAILDGAHLKKINHPIVPKIIELRELSKITKTYLVGISEKCDAEGVIHCDFNQVGAKTGRFSCKEPNLQNIPRNGVVDIRRAFVARPNYSNYYFDYSQIELRILAHYSQDTLMLDTLIAGGDLHAVTAEAIFGADFTKEDRSIAKQVNFGIIYGIGAKSFAQILNEKYPAKKFYTATAKKFINRYFKTYTSVKKFMRVVDKTLKERGFVQDIFNRKFTTEKDKRYCGVNYLIQGCAADVIKDAMINVYEYLEDKMSNILLTIHDELVIEVHETEEYVVAEILDIMEDRQRFRVPLTVNIEKTSTSWSQKVPYNDTTSQQDAPQ